MDTLRVGSLAEQFRQDLTYALRTLSRAPGYAAISIATLGVAIGLNASLFNVFETVFVRPWPVADSAHVVSVTRDRIGHSDLSIAEYTYLAGHQQTLDGLVASRCIDGWESACTVDVSGQRTRASFVSANFFDVLGVPMARGRRFAAGDTDGAVAVISYREWQAQFGGASDVIGRRVLIDAIPFTIVGVTARSFSGTRLDGQDVWIPLTAMPALRPFDDSLRDAFDQPGYCCVSVAGRLRHGVSRGEARAELDLLSTRFRTEFVPDRLNSGTIALESTTLSPGLRLNRRMYVPFALMFAGVLLVLMLACANVGNLLLARGAARQFEIATRVALGAGRGRLVRQLMTENFVLAATAGLVGFAIAAILPARVLPFVAGESFAFRLAPDLVVFAFTAAIAALSCACFGILPAFTASRVDLVAAVKSGDANGRASNGWGSLRGTLLALQVTISAVLVCASGLMVRAVEQATATTSGLSIDDVRVLSVDLPASADPSEARAITADLVSLLTPFQRDVPMGLTTLAPFTAGGMWSNVLVPRPGGAAERAVLPWFQVTAGYFDVLGIPILRGRGFARGDEQGHFIVVNDALAKQFWPGEPALGRTIVKQNVAFEIIGVARDADTDADALDHEVAPTMFVPMGTFPATTIPSVVTRGNAAHAEAMRGVVARLAPTARTQLTLLTDVRTRSLGTAWVAPVLASSLGALALGLAAVGVFSMFAYTVQQKTREIGIRIALGATTARVIGVMLRSAAVPLSVGLTLGFLAAIAGARLIRAYLYGLSPLDPLAYVAAAAVLMAAAVIASYVPARRAARIDPAVSLKAG